MEEFFIRIVDALPILLVALPAGWLGSMAQSYFSEKGKNLATKQDIQEITEKVEFVKNHFTKKHLRSKAYIERQISAYDSIFQSLYEITNISHETDEKIEFIDEQGLKVCKVKYTLSKNLLNELEKHKIYTSPYVHEATTNVAENLYELSKAEYFASLMAEVGGKQNILEKWSELLDLIDDAQILIRRELIDE